MAMILTPPCSPHVSFVRTLIAPTRILFIHNKYFSNMRSYMTLVVLALAASTASPDLSAPVQYRYGNLLVQLKARPS